MVKVRAIGDPMPAQARREALGRRRMKILYSGTVPELARTRSRTRRPRTRPPNSPELPVPNSLPNSLLRLRRASPQSLNRLPPLVRARHSPAPPCMVTFGMRILPDTAAEAAVGAVPDAGTAEHQPDPGTPMSKRSKPVHLMGSDRCRMGTFGNRPGARRKSSTSHPGRSNIHLPSPSPSSSTAAHQSPRCTLRDRALWLR